MKKILLLIGVINLTSVCMEEYTQPKISREERVILVEAFLQQQTDEKSEPRAVFQVREYKDSDSEDESCWNCRCIVQ